jgi:hypothetical protein
MNFKFEVDNGDDLIFFISGLLLAGMFLYKNNFKSYLSPIGFPIIFLLIVSIILFYATFISLKLLRANKIL